MLLHRKRIHLFRQPCILFWTLAQGLFMWNLTADSFSPNSKSAFIFSSGGTCKNLNEFLATINLFQVWRLGALFSFLAINECQTQLFGRWTWVNKYQYQFVVCYAMENNFFSPNFYWALWKLTSYRSHSICLKGLL